MIDTLPGSVAVAVADETTILARVDETLAVYPLPKPRRVRAQAERLYSDSVLAAFPRASLTSLPPALHLYWRTGPEMQAWAAHLAFPLQVRVATYDDDVCRTVDAHGMWLGWSVYLSADEDSYRNITPPPLAAIVLKARKGILL